MNNEYIRNRITKFISLWQTNLAFKALMIYLLVFILLTGYIYIHIPFSYMISNPLGATTSIPYLLDVLVILLIAELAAFAWGRPKGNLNLFPKILFILLSIVIIAIFAITGAELSLHQHPAEWINYLLKNVWLFPYYNTLSKPVLWARFLRAANFNLRGIVLSFVSIGFFLRELCWYWIVVPLVDKRYALYENPIGIIILLLFMALFVDILGVAFVVVSNEFLGVVKSSIIWIKLHWHTVRLSSKLFLQRLQYAFGSIRVYLLWFGKIFSALVIIVTLLDVIGVLLTTPKGNLEWSEVPVGNIPFNSYPFINTFVLASDGNTLVAGTAEQGVLLSSDHGNTWVVSNLGLGSSNVEKLVVASGQIYAETDKGIYRSSDNTGTWTAANSGLQNLYVNNLILGPDNTYLFVVSNVQIGKGNKKQIFRYDIQNNSWSLASNGLGNVDVDSIAVTGDGKTILAVSSSLANSTSQNIYESTDNGMTWNLTEQLKGKYPGSLVGVQANGQTELFANTYIPKLINGGGTEDLPGPIFKFNKDSQNWEEVPSLQNGDSLTSLTFLPSDDSLIAVVGSQIYKSDRKEDAWMPISSIINRFNLAIPGLEDPTTGDLFLGGDGLLRSRDQGHTWSEINSGIRTISIRRIYSAPDSRYNLVETSNGVFYYSIDGGNNWKELLTPNALGYSNNIALDPLKEGHVFIGDYHGNIQDTFDNGNTWNFLANLGNAEILSQIYLPESDSLIILTSTNGVQYIWKSDSGLKNFRLQYSFIAAGSFDSLFMIGENLYLTDSQGSNNADSLYVSGDFGRTWTHTGSLFWKFDSLIRSYDNKRLFATIAEKQNSIQSVEYSDDGGASWQISNSGLPNQDVSEIMLGPDHRSLLARTSQGGIFVSRDNGTTWVSYTQSSGLLQFTTSMSVNYSDNIILVGNDSGLYRSVDNGNTWQEIDNQLKDIDVGAIAIDTKDRSLYVGGNGYVARSLNEGQTWELVGMIDPNLYINQLLFDPKSNLLIAKGEYPVNSDVYYYNDKQKAWIMAPGDSDQQPCDYDCRLSLSPDGQSLLLIEYLRKIYSFDSELRTWKSLMDLPSVGGPNYVWSTSLNQSGNVLNVIDTAGAYELDPKKGSYQIISNNTPLSINISTLPLNYFSSNVRVQIADSQIMIGRPGMGWLSFSKYQNYKPLAITMGDNKLIFYGIAGRDILLRAEEPLPIIWSAPTAYLDSVAFTWFAIDWVVANPAVSTLSVALIVIFGMMTVFINTSYFSFRRRFDAGDDLEKLILIIMPLDYGLGLNQIRDRLRSVRVLPGINNLHNALGELVERDLLSRKQEEYKIAEPLISIAFRLLTRKPSVEQLAEQVRESHPSILATAKFLKGAGFNTSFVTPYGILCTSSSPLWQDVSPFYAHLIVENELTLDEFQNLIQSTRYALGNEAKGRTVLVILDRPPRASDLYQIFAQRSQQGINIVPIALSSINLGLLDGSEILTLRSQIDLYTGRSDLYDMRSSVSDVLSFFGRASTLAEVQRQLINGNSVAVYGVRKIGKSSFINRLKEEINWVVAFVDLEGYGTGLKYVYENILQNWWGSLKGKFPNLETQDLVLASNSDPNDRVQIFRKNCEILLNLLANQSGRPGILLVLDEMDILLDLREYFELSTVLRSLAEDPRWRGRFAVVMAGLDPAVNRLDRIREGRNPFYQFLSEFPLGPLTHEDTKTMIVSIGGQMGISYTDDAVNAIAKASGGHPFISRQICSQAIRDIERPNTIEEERANNAIKQYLSFSRNYMAETLWGIDSGGPSDDDATILKALSENLGQKEDELILPSLQQKKRRSLQIALDRLNDMSLIRQYDSGWSITIPIFRTWIRRNILGYKEG